MSSPQHDFPTSPAAGVAGDPRPTESTAPWRTTIEPEVVLQLPRAALGWPIRAPLPDEVAGTRGRPLPDALSIDPGLWLAWCTVGLELAASVNLGAEPDSESDSWLEVIGEAAKQLLTMLAMYRADGNITHAAHGLRTSRAAVRRRLKREGLHPWPEQPVSTTQQRLATLGLELHPPMLAPPGEVTSDIRGLAEALERAQVSRADGT